MSRPITVQSVIAKGDGRTTFGGSLYLVVRGGSARWEYQFRDPSTKKLKSLWLGSAIGPAAVSFTAAKVARAAAYVERKSGAAQSSIETVNESLTLSPAGAIAPPPSNGMTFGEALHAYLDERAPHWHGGADGTEAKQWRSSLTDKPIMKLTLSQINVAVTRDNLMSFPPVQRERVRKRITAVLRFMETGQSKPKRPTVKHMDAMPWREVPEFFDQLSAIREPTASAARERTARALQWTILTGVRSGAVLAATWGQINGDNWTFTVRKGGSVREFKVPLTEQMRSCLPPRGADGDRVFKIGAMEMVRLVHRLYKGPAQTHGFRTSFREWAAEQGYPWELGEYSLAHKVGDATARAYARSDQFERRREMMQAWSNHVTGKVGAGA